MATIEEVLALATNEARKRGYSPEREQELLVGSWYSWHGMKNKSYSASVYVGYGFRRLFRGSEWGHASCHRDDVLDKCGRFQHYVPEVCGSRYPEPTAVVAHADWLLFVSSRLSPKCVRLFWCIANGCPTQKAARKRLGLGKHAYATVHKRLALEMSALV